MHASLSHLLVVNLLLQLIDGLASFYILSAGVPEANPVVALAIENWGLTRGLLYSKLLGCALLLLVFVLGHKVGSVATRGMMILAGVYSCLGLALVVKMLVLFA
jgi:hypothetical protein